MSENSQSEQICDKNLRKQQNHIKFLTQKMSENSKSEQICDKNRRKQQFLAK